MNEYVDIESYDQAPQIILIGRFDESQSKHRRVYAVKINDHAIYCTEFVFAKLGRIICFFPREWSLSEANFVQFESDDGVSYSISIVGFGGRLRLMIADAGSTKYIFSLTQEQLEELRELFAKHIDLSPEEDSSDGSAGL